MGAGPGRHGYFGRSLVCGGPMVVALCKNALFYWLWVVPDCIGYCHDCPAVPHSADSDEVGAFRSGSGRDVFDTSRMTVASGLIQGRKANFVPPIGIGAMAMETRLISAPWESISSPLPNQRLPDTPEPSKPSPTLIYARHTILIYARHYDSCSKR